VLRRLTRIGGGDAWLRWSPDGRTLLVVPTASGLGLQNPDGSGRRYLRLPLRASSFENPVWSPDWKQLAVLVVLDHQDRQQLHTLKADGSELRRIPVRSR
jgi:Tol biopolymer transport system component